MEVKIIDVDTQLTIRAEADHTAGITALVDVVKSGYDHLANQDILDGDKSLTIYVRKQYTDASAELGTETALELVPILMAEIGDVSKFLQRLKRYPKSSNIWESELKVALADSAFQLHQIAQKKGYSIGGLIETGRLRFIERIKDIENANRPNGGD